MTPFDFFCPCCTGALLHSLVQTSTSCGTPQLFLELGKRALVTTIERSSLRIVNQAQSRATVPSDDLPYRHQPTMKHTKNENWVARTYFQIIIGRSRSGVLYYDLISSSERQTGVLMFLATIATSLLLFIGITWIQQVSAQLPLKPFSGKPAPKLASPDRIVSLVDRDRDRLVTIFKDIHQNPELGFRETRTAAIVAKELKGLGYEVKTGGKTGVPDPTGLLANTGGTRMAGSDAIDVTIKGIGGHGSSPQFAKDPVVMTAHAITQYQTVVAHAIDPQEAAVITVGSVQAGQDNNVIPGESLVKINLRWFNPVVRETMIKGIRSVNRHLRKHSSC